MIPIAAAGRDTLGIVLLVITGGGALALLGWVASAAIKRRSAAVPPGLRPGPSDEELERRSSVNYVRWGALATLFLALFLPVYWFREPTRLDLKADQFVEESIARGARQYGANGANCASCHGAEGEGGVRTFRVGDQQLPYAEPPLKYMFARYQAAGRNPEEIRQILRDAIERGRPGTPMPTWSLEFGGPLNSQQVQDLVNYVESIQEVPPAPQAPFDGAQLFAQNCAICHGPDATGGIAPNLTVAFARNSPEQIFETIKEGRLNTNRPSMPAWAHLGDDAIRALVDFLRSIQRG